MLSKPVCGQQTTRPCSTGSKKQPLAIGSPYLRNITRAAGIRVLCPPMKHPKPGSFYCIKTVYRAADIKGGHGCHMQNGGTTKSAFGFGVRYFLHGEASGRVSLDNFLKKRPVYPSVLGAFAGHNKHPRVKHVIFQMWSNPLFPACASNV